MNPTASHIPAAVPLKRFRLAGRSVLTELAVLIGLVMPLLSAAIYPTYAHMMASPEVEWTRLIELPFVGSELAVIALALRRGLNSGAYWQRLPPDVKGALALLTVGLFASTLWVSRQPLHSAEISLITLVHLQFALAVYHLARRERLADLGAFVPILGAGVVALGLLTAWKFLLPPPSGSVLGGKIEWSNALPGFISVRHFGAWCGAVASGLMIAVLYPAAQARRAPLLLLYVAAVTLTAWSGTRAAVAAMGAVALVAGVTLRRAPRRADLLAFGLATFVALVLGFVLPAPSGEFWLFNSSDLDSAEALTGGRLALWNATYHKWLEAPLLGWGSGSTFWEVYVGWSHTQPHNAVLQFLVSWGAVGAAGALWLIARTIAAVHRPGFGDPTLRPLAAVVYALLCQSLLEGMLHYPRFIMMIVASSAIILAQRPSLPARPSLSPH